MTTPTPPIDIAAEIIAAFDRGAAEAALDEGLAPLPERLIEKRERFLAMQQLKKQLEADMKDLRDEIGAELVEQGLQGFTHGGRVVCRYSEITTNKIDTAEIKKNEPTLWGKLFETFGKVTKTERVVIN